MNSNESRKRGAPEESHKGGPCHINTICFGIVDIFGTKPSSCHAALKKNKDQKKKQRLKIKEKQRLKKKAKTIEMRETKIKKKTKTKEN